MWCYCKPLSRWVVNVCLTSCILIVFVSFFVANYVWCPDNITLLCSGNGTEITIGDTWTYSWELSSNFIYSCYKLLWCYRIAFWWFGEFNISHNSSYLYQYFSKGFVLWIRLHRHWSKLNGLASMVISRSQYKPLTKVIFSSPEICGKILNIF